MEERKQKEDKPITIYDIAKEAGVSPSTVSRVLTNKVKVNPKKRDIICKIMEKYDFKPNALARSLADTKSNTIGIITADVRNPFYAQIFVACEVAARRAGYIVLLCNSMGETDQEKQLLTQMQEQRVDAVIQLGGRADDLESNPSYVEQANRLIKTMPLVVSGKLDGTDAYQVQIDAVKAMESIMEYLIRLKHTKIAMIGGRMDVLSTYEKRQTYLKVLERHQIKPVEAFMRDNGEYSYEAGYRSMNELLSGTNIPTAVIAINDFSATGIIRSIIEHGYRIPQDISVVSYDNTYMANFLIPKLTSVDYNYEAYGEKLVQTAILASRKEEVPRIQYIEPTIVIRESSGPAPISV